MPARSSLVLGVVAAAALALPSTAAAQDEEPIYDCTDAPFRLVPFTCLAWNTAMKVVDLVPAPAQS